MVTPTSSVKVRQKAMIPLTPITPIAGPSRTRTKAKRRKKAVSKTPITAGSIIDLTGEDEEDGAIRFLGGEDLDDAVSVASTPNGGGPSRTKSPGLYTPVSFTPLASSLGSLGRKNRTSPIETVNPPYPSDKVSLNDSVLKNGSPPVEDGGHFDPPALFGTSMMPEPVELGPDTAEVQVELRPIAEDSTTKSDKETGLLLPANVMLESDPAADEQDGPPSSPIEGVHFLDDQVTRGAQRYFDPSAPATTDEQAAFLATADQAKICKRCKKPGHHARNCTHVMCHLCGAIDEHERKDCPMGLVCFNCGQRGHKNTDCTQSRAGSSRHGCTLCGDSGHLTGNCPTVWRTYIYHSTSHLESHRATRLTYTNWHREAAGGHPSERWCYNCAHEGHLGDDCPRRRGSLARVTFASAFSAEVANSGPFQLAKPAKGTHLHFDDELEGQTAEFAGLGAGKKGKEKAKRKLEALEREADNEEGDWFSSKRKGRNGMNESGTDEEEEESWMNRPTNARILAIRGTATPTSLRPQGGGRGGKPWDSTPRRHPFSVVGLPASVPGRRSAAVNGDTDSPSIRASKGRGGKFENGINNSSRTNLNFPPTPISATSTPTNPKVKAKNKAKRKSQLDSNSVVDISLDTPVKSIPQDSPIQSIGRRARKKKRAEGGGEGASRGEGGERDWEGEWRRSGAGGGNVSTWGGEMDVWEKEKEKDKEKNIGKVKGQRYTGGY
ncbi:hypothetical protein BCR39DRAFT_518431 [Naematelia encephala]|uniref:CCHC-type domain-containing protein n=1 Tax=Naematelia encephala TaxID=71784 RepID=A0A1Y2BH18_9TREE|nr:hypothetical protein BCR39DRAFT_518431 [Naematelia encephala]